MFDFEIVEVPDGGRVPKDDELIQMDAHVEEANRLINGPFPSHTRGRQTGTLVFVVRSRRKLRLNTCNLNENAGRNLGI